MTLGAATLAFAGPSLIGSGSGGLVTPPYAGSLIAYVGASTPVGYGPSGGLLCADNGAAKLYFIELDALTGADGLKKIDAALPGDELLQHTSTAYFAADHVFNGIGCAHPNGNLYLSLDSSNSRPFAIVKSSDLSLVGTAGVNSSTLDLSAWPRLTASFQMGPLRAGGRDYLLSRGASGGGLEREIAVLDVTDSVGLAYVEQITEEVAAFCPGYSGTGRSFATFYVLGCLFNYAGGDPTPAVLYEYIVGDNVDKRTLRSISPAQIDATWTNFSAISTPGFDKSDGGVLAFFSTLDVVTNTIYLAKFARADGALMWTLPIADTPAPSIDLPQCNINGTLEFFTRELVGTSFVTRVDLSTGAATTTAWNRGLAAFGGQVFDYLTGSITGNTDYTASTGPIPTYLGDYLAAHSNVIPTNRWGRIYSGAPYPNDNPSPSPTGTQRRVAWSFVLDGHTFYVLDLGTEGTFAWDDISKHWSSFTTSNTTPQWNMAGGCMWGDRIVAGDLTSGVVWELDPNAVQDNGALDILHAATGFITRRSRNYMGVGAVRVAASVGQIQDSAGATMRLRFSDDQEKTWSAYYDVALTQGDYSGEIAYRGLGSFAAPGRVFELSDTSGLIRIDGCDLDPEKDPDEQAS